MDDHDPDHLMVRLTIDCEWFNYAAASAMMAAREFPDKAHRFTPEAWLQAVLMEALSHKAAGDSAGSPEGRTPTLFDYIRIRRAHPDIFLPPSPADDLEDDIPF